MFLTKHRFVIILVVLLNLLLTPLSVALFPVADSFLPFINLSLVSIGGLILARQRSGKIVVFVFACLSLLAVTTEFVAGYMEMAARFRMFANFALYLVLGIVLTRNFVMAKDMTLPIIFGAIAGYILIGFIGGSVFEILESFDPEAINISSIHGFDYYYYSFVSLVTIGYGDILPVSPPAKAITIMVGLLGQFYMAVGVALFVGKYLMNRNN